jgi:hypothetical protein
MLSESLETGSLLRGREIMGEARLGTGNNAVAFRDQCPESRRDAVERRLPLETDRLEEQCRLWVARYREVMDQGGWREFAESPGEFCERFLGRPHLWCELLAESVDFLDEQRRSPESRSGNDEDPVRDPVLAA